MASHSQFIRPAWPDLIVQHEDGRRLPPEGETVAWSVWWERRLVVGDITLDGLPVTRAKAKPETPDA